MNMKHFFLKVLILRKPIQRENRRDIKIPPTYDLEQYMQLYIG